jgi:hypothetical protein
VDRIGIVEASHRVPQTQRNYARSLSIEVKEEPHVHVHKEYPKRDRLDMASSAGLNYSQRFEM